MCVMSISLRFNTLSRAQKMKIFFGILVSLFWEKRGQKSLSHMSLFRFLHKNTCGNISPTITDSLLIVTATSRWHRTSLQTTSINGTSKIRGPKIRPRRLSSSSIFFFSLSLSLSLSLLKILSMYSLMMGLCSGGGSKRPQTDKDGRMTKTTTRFFVITMIAKENNDDGCYWLENSILSFLLFFLFENNPAAAETPLLCH